MTLMDPLLIFEYIRSEDKKKKKNCRRGAISGSGEMEVSRFLQTLNILITEMKGREKYA